MKSEPDLSGYRRRSGGCWQTCLEKDPKKRLRDIGDARDFLDDDSAEAAPPARTGLRRPLWAGIAVVALAIGAGAGWMLYRSRLRRELRGSR